MRKLKILFSHNVNPFSKLLGPLATEGITTDVALLKITDLNSLSSKTGIASQALRALQQTVIRMTSAYEETEFHSVTKFSTGYPILNDVLYGGYEFGQIVEIYGCVEKSKFVLKTIKTFLNDHPNATVHHIDASGTFEPRDLGDQNEQIMTRIHCYEAFTATELHQLLEQISALYLTTATTSNINDSNTSTSFSSSSSASILIVINGLVNLMSTEWDNVTTTKVSDMLCTMASVRKLSLSILMVRTAQSSDEFSSNKRILRMWDSCVDLRIHLQQKQQTPPLSSSMIITPSTKSIITYQCDIDKARMPVVHTRVTLSEI